VPAVMVSTAMQGGCSCENTSLLRLEAGNIDLAALAAPRPMALIAADDWTKDLMTKGYPALKRLYGMLGVEDRLDVIARLDFRHNYNQVNRTFMAQFFNRHFGLGVQEPIEEKDYRPLTREELSVWNETHPAPTGDQTGEAHERGLLRWLTDDSNRQLAPHYPKKPKDYGPYRDVFLEAFQTLLGHSTPFDIWSTNEERQHVERDDYLMITSLLTLDEPRQQLPMVWFYPTENWNRRVILILHPDGKSHLFENNGAPRPEVARLIAGGYAVIGVDLFQQGEFLKDGGRLEKARLNNAKSDRRNPFRNYAGYTFGYNRSLFARRVHDVLMVLRYIRYDKRDPLLVNLWGRKGTGPIAIAARMLAENTSLGDTAVDTAGFRFAD
ncbi:MAG: hypothetical protein AAF492_29610, partial [Verrucomicrobiota bacterium]